MQTRKGNHVKIFGFWMLLLVIPLFFPAGLLAQETDSEETGSFKKSAPSPFSDASEEIRKEKEPFRKKDRGIKGKKGKRERETKEDKRIKSDKKFEKIKKGKEMEECLPTEEEDCPPAEEEDKKEQPLSPFEAYVRGQTESPTLWDIDQFGYDLFKRPPSTFAPADMVPVGPDYLLGPGDELVITLWGKINSDFLAVIDPEGKISLPDAGMLPLSGLTFAGAKTYLEKELSRYYRPSEVKMNISMGRLRSLRAFVVGKAARPGSYTLSSFSTLINAVFASGGPSKSGTMRDIQLKRSGKTIVHFDLYDFLLKGDKTKDVRLLPEDVIFIPSIGPLVGIAGHIKNPAIYELKEEVRLLDLIEMAGGLTAIAFQGRVQVQRVEDHRLTTFFEGNLIEIAGDPKKNLLLKDGDIARIFPVMEGGSIVILSGAVGAPGEFGVTTGVTRVKDVLEQAGGLLYYAFEEGDITRVRVTQKGPQTEYIKINFKKALEADPAHNVPLEMNDSIFVRSVPEWQLYRKVQIKGEVLFPGEYTITRGDTLRALVDRAGGFTEKAYLKGAVFTRESVRELQGKHLTETIDRLEQQLISSGAGTLETATTQESALLQKSALDQRKELLVKLRAAKPLGRVSLDLETPDTFRTLSSDIVLEEGDVLFVPERPSSVQVMGSVYNQGSYLYASEVSISDYLKKSGGMGRDADDDEIYVLKVDGTAVSRRAHNKSFFLDGFMRLKLDPGDTIVVPEKIEKIAWLRETKDVVQILFQIAVTAGVLIPLF